MRPIDRGPAPRDASGNAMVYAEYADARADLLARIGRYCSFCERPIKAALAVEHIHHKDKYPNLERVWSNFLLACSNCNATKGTKEVDRKQILLPDQDNTFLAISYSVGGLVEPNRRLNPSGRAKCKRLIRLVGLDKVPKRDPQARDLRWNDRREAWDKAERYLRKYRAGSIDKDTILELCQADGHWSIWMTVFTPIDEIRRDLIAAIPGTATSCFDASGFPVRRRGGQV